MEAKYSTPHSSLGLLLRVALWFGIVTGLTEGAGLLIFQRINWAQWGRIIHVSQEILWISPLVDMLFFLLVALLASLLARLVPRLPAVRTLVFLLTFLSVYDWLTLTGRLYRSADLVLALGVAVAFTRWFGTHQDAALRFWKRSTPWVVVALALTIVGIQGGQWLQERRALAKLPSPASGSPNVLVIVVDTLRADHLSAYGYARPTSPNLDRMAQQGALFENAISTCSWSYPSHVSLLTGRYQFEHGMDKVGPMPVFGSGAPSLGGYPTLGEALEQRGYRTGAFSANRTYFSRSLGFGRGFTHFEDYFHSPADMFVRTLFGKEFARIYLVRSDKSKVKRLLRFLGIESLLDTDAEGSASFGGGQAVRKRAAAVSQEVLGWIDDGPPQRPFFAVLNYFDVHFPYGGPRLYPRSGWPRGGVVDEYDDSVKYLDDSLAQLMAELDKRGLSQATLLVITSDHGESLGQHGLAFHGEALYREQIHVPLIFWYPGHVPAGIRLPTPVSNAAIPRTIMDLLGGNGQDIFPGPPLSALWNSPQSASNWPDPLSELAQNKYTAKQDRAAGSIPTATTGSMQSLVTAQQQLIVHEKLGSQLYDWAHDPGETNNLINTPEGQAAAANLQSQMRRLKASRRQPQ